MKRYFFIIVIVLMGIILFFVTRSNNKTYLKEVRVAEVTHSLFYAPFYVAIENGYFKDNGIDLDLVLASGADKVTAAVLSNDVQIGFAGPESAIYVYKNGEKDYLVTFAGLTKRDGQFIVARDKNEYFDVKELYGKEILIGRKGGMPALNFYNAMKNSNIDTSKIDINESIDFASLTGTFISGVGDYVNLFEPNASKLEKEGLGYVVGSIGELSGEMPYTAFYAKKSYIDNNIDTIKDFNDAVNKGLDYINSNSIEDVAKLLIKQFPDNSLSEIEMIVKRYKNNDSWLDNTTITEDLYNNLEDLMIDNNLLDTYVPFNDLVINFNE